MVLLLAAGCRAKTKEELYGEGMKRMQAKDPSGAIAYLKNAIEKDPSHIEARYELAGPIDPGKIGLNPGR